MKNWRELSNKYRSLPLDQVIMRLGGVVDQRDKQKCQTPNATVWLGKGKDSQKFFNHVNGTGGGGAIDLVMHILQIDF
jgi:hypothetical protein